MENPVGNPAAEANPAQNPAEQPGGEPAENLPAGDLPANPSYQRKEPFAVTERIRRQIAGAVAEIDLQQMAITARLTPAERVRMAASMIDACERVGVSRLRQRQSELSEEEALRIVRGGLLNYYRERGTWPKKESPS